MVNESFKKLSEAYIKRTKLNRAIDDMETELNKVKLTDRYIDVDQSGVSIKRTGKFDIISLDELKKVEECTGTTLYLVNEKYYMLAWNHNLKLKEDD
ncbi:MAG: hypothetical protein IJF83_07445 [Methanobrevibacter sp.]|nr:hypothetical protein [Methanobrevibacter sp.]